MTSITRASLRSFKQLSILYFMIEVCFSRSYTQRKTADLAGSAVFILSVSIFHKLHLNDLLQASRLVIHPGFHAANIVRLYATVTNVTAVVVLHPDQTLLKIIVLRAVMGVSVEQNGAATHVLPTKDRVMA